MTDKRNSTYVSYVMFPTANILGNMTTCIFLMNLVIQEACELAMLYSCSSVSDHKN